MLGEQLNFDEGAVMAPSRIDVSGVDLLGQGLGKDKRQSQQRSIVNVAVRLRPASTSQRLLHELIGRIKDLSTTGCGVILQRPPYVGDIYRFQMIEEHDALFEGIVGRCVRCHLIDEEVFEAGFQFLAALRRETISDGLL